jgi:hypothetical protein
VIISLKKDFSLKLDHKFVCLYQNLITHRNSILTVSIRNVALSILSSHVQKKTTRNKTLWRLTWQIGQNEIHYLNGPKNNKNLVPGLTDQTKQDPLCQINHKLSFVYYSKFPNFSRFSDRRSWTSRLYWRLSNRAEKMRTLWRKTLFLVCEVFSFCSHLLF